jgi:hypothetical protein
MGSYFSAKKENFTRGKSQTQLQFFFSFKMKNQFIAGIAETS